MSEKIKQKKLQRWLKTWYCDSRAIVDAAPSHLYLEQEQAYNQIKALIQEWFEYIEKVEKSKIALKRIRKRIQNQLKIDDYDVEVLAFECILAKHIVQVQYNQPEMSMKDIEGWADEIRERVTNHDNWSYAADTIKEMLKEMGAVIINDKHTKE